MLQLRDYQRAAIDALYEYWNTEGSGNGLIVLPTGAGKALVIAKIIEELLGNYPSLRIANVTHSKTLVGQNFKEFIGLMPFAPAGIYSAGLGRRDTHAQVLFCGIQSVAHKTAELGPIDLVLVDEAHAISRNSDTLYGKFFAGVKSMNEDSRVAGTTATDYRMDSGSLTEGKDRLFDDVVYEIGLSELIEQGYLCRLSSKPVDVKIDLTGVGKRGGEFIAGQLEAASDKIEITQAAVSLAIARGADRKAWLFFCSGQDHSDHVRDEVRRQGITCESITSRVPLAEQARIIADFQAGRVRALASANMLTTGFNVPQVDLISMLRPTASAGLYVQICGRGTRNAPGKTDCLVLDHAGNIGRHGPVDMVKPKAPGSGSGEPPLKQCPECEELIHISVMKCPCCGYDFPPNEEEKITAKPADAPILSREKDMWRAVTSRRFAEHPGKEGKPNSVKCTYMAGYLAVNNWLCPQHGGFAKTKADRFWLDHGGQRPFPATVEAFLLRQHELNDTAEIEIEYNGKYPNARNHRAAATNDNQREADNDNDVLSEEYLDDFIPF